MGLGNVGLPVAVHVSKCFPTFGYDVSEKAVARALESGVTASVTLEDADIYVVIVNTWFRNGAVDTSAVEDCCNRISKENPEALISFESTLAAGTARRMSSTYNLSRVVVCPHRWWSEDTKSHGVVQLRVIGALDRESMEQGTSFYRVLGVPLHRLSSLEMAELTKIVENSHRFVQIAFAEEVALIAQKNGLDFKELREACNTKWNVEILEPRNGIGRECLPKDIRFLLQLDENAQLLSGAVDADNRYVNALKNGGMKHDKEIRVR